MPSETFFCPHCRRQLTKSAAVYVRGEMMASKKAAFIDLGHPKTTTCPGCGGLLDTKKMILGEYDGGMPGSLGCLPFIAAAVAFAGILVFGGDKLVGNSWVLFGVPAAVFAAFLLVDRLRGAK